MASGVNNSGWIIGKANYTGTDPNVAPGSHGVLLPRLYWKITFEAVADNWEIEDNKTLDDKWMPGRGKRMFVDAKSPTDNQMRDTVYVKVQPCRRG